MIAGVGVASQLMSLFKLMFGHPQMLVIKELTQEETLTTVNKRKLIRSLSSVYNQEGLEGEEGEDEEKELSQFENRHSFTPQR